jgi:hypothetical protein
MSKKIDHTTTIYESALLIRSGVSPRITNSEGTGCELRMGALMITNCNRACLAKMAPRGLQEVMTGAQVASSRADYSLQEKKAEPFLVLTQGRGSM